MTEVAVHEYLLPYLPGLDSARVGTWEMKTNVDKTTRYKIGITRPHD